jgi:uncharacterized Zn finger protein
MTEDAAAKGRRLLGEGRLTVLQITPQLIYAQVRGDSGAVYNVGYEAGKNEWRCSCEARGRCSHIRALQLVTVIAPPDKEDQHGDTD